MLKNKTSRIISFVLAIMTLVSLISFCANAACNYQTNAFDILTASKYAKTYTISTTGRTIPYTSKYLSTRGTTNGASNSAYIDNAADEIYLMDVGTTNGKTWAYVSYPVSSGRRNAYIYLSAISNAAYNSKHLYYASSLGKFYCSPRKGGSTSSSYYVDSGDKVYVVYAGSTSGTNVQILYPISNGKWRLGWCKYSDAEKYLDGTSSNNLATYTGYVNTSSAPLVLRKSASTSSQALANMPKGSTLTVLDNKQKTNGFYHVKYNGMTGYASASYITFTRTSSTQSSSSNTSSGSYSIQGNILTVKGVKMSEYPIGSKFENCNYANVNGNRVYTGAKQCYGYACYIEHKLYGHCWHTANNRFPNLTGSENVIPKTTSHLKSLITSAGVGAHLRTRSGHSMVLIGYSDSGFTVADANAKGTNVVDVRTYTWSSYLQSQFGQSGFSFIEIHK